MLFFADYKENPVSQTTTQDRNVKERKNQSQQHSNDERIFFDQFNCSILLSDCLDVYLNLRRNECDSCCSIPFYKYINAQSKAKLCMFGSDEEVNLRVLKFIILPVMCWTDEDEEKTFPVQRPQVILQPKGRLRRP